MIYLNYKSQIKNKLSYGEFYEKTSLMIKNVILLCVGQLVRYIIQIK